MKGVASLSYRCILHRDRIHSRVEGPSHQRLDTQRREYRRGQQRAVDLSRLSRAGQEFSVRFDSFPRLATAFAVPRQFDRKGSQLDAIFISRWTEGPCVTRGLPLVSCFPKHDSGANNDSLLRGAYQLMDLELSGAGDNPCHAHQLVRCSAY